MQWKTLTLLLIVINNSATATFSSSNSLKLKLSRSNEISIPATIGSGKESINQVSVPIALSLTSPTGTLLSALRPARVTPNGHYYHTSSETDTMLSSSTPCSSFL